MQIKGLGWPTSDGDRSVWDWWEMGFFDEREREREREREKDIIRFGFLGF